MGRTNWHPSARGGCYTGINVTTGIMLCHDMDFAIHLGSISGRVRALNLTVPLGSGRVGSDNLGYGPGSGFSFEPVQTSTAELLCLRAFSLVTEWIHVFEWIEWVNWFSGSFIRTANWLVSEWISRLNEKKQLIRSLKQTFAAAYWWLNHI